MTKEVEVKSYKRNKPAKRKKDDKPSIAPQTISDPQERSPKGVSIIGGGGDFTKPEIGKGVNVLKRKD